MKSFIIEMYKGIRYSIKSLRGPNLDVVLKKRVWLKEPKLSKKKFLFLDLDETLIHTNRNKLGLDEQPIDAQLFQLYIRPYAYEFLEKVSEHFEVYVFTAATK